MAKIQHNVENHSDTRQKMVELAVQKELLNRIKKINETEKE